MVRGPLFFLLLVVFFYFLKQVWASSVVKENAVKLQNCFVEQKTSSDFGITPSAWWYVDHVSILLFWQTSPLNEVYKIKK